MQTRSFETIVAHIEQSMKGKPYEIRVDTTGGETRYGAWARLYDDVIVLTDSGTDDVAYVSIAAIEMVSVVG